MKTFAFFVLTLLLVGFSGAFDGNTIISVAQDIRFSRHHGVWKDSIETLAKHEKWKVLPRSEIISNLVEFAISEEMKGSNPVSRAALDLLQYQPFPEFGSRLYDFSSSRTNLSNKVVWTMVAFSMIGAEFAPILAEECRKGTMSQEERRSTYWIAKQFLEAREDGTLIPKQTAEERARIRIYLQTALPLETNDKSFIELDWIICENYPEWAFSDAHFMLLESRAVQFTGTGQNPYEKTLGTWKRRLSTGDTNIVPVADMPPFESKYKIRIR